MKVRYEDYDDEFEMKVKKPLKKKKKKNEAIEDRKDQKRYKKSHRVYRDKFFQEEDSYTGSEDFEEE